MSAEYGLYQLDSKKYIWLGKMLPSMSKYQLDSDVIVGFLLQFPHGATFHLLADFNELPEETEPGWVKVAD